MSTSARRTRSHSSQRQDTDVEFLFVRHRPVTPDFRSQQLADGVLAALSEDARVQRVQDVDRHGLWPSHAQGFGKMRFRCLAIVCSDCRQRSSKLLSLGNSRFGLQSVVGPEVLQLRDVFQKEPLLATANPVVVSEQRQDASVFR